MDRDCKSYQTMRAKSKKGSNNGHQLRGYLTWTLLHFFCLSGTDNQPSFPPTLHWLLSKQGFKKDARDDDVSFKTIFKNMETRYDVRLNTLCNYFVDINLALFFGDAEFPIMHTVPLFKKTSHFQTAVIGKLAIKYATVEMDQRTDGNCGRRRRRIRAESITLGRPICR